MSNELIAVKQKNKEDSKILKWVSLACSKDKSWPVLNGIKVNNGEIAAADGFRLHVANTPDALKPHNEKILNPVGTISATPKYDEFITEPGTFPDYEQIIPKDEPYFLTAVNKKFLAALATMPGDDAIILEFYKPGAPMKVTNPGSGAVAVIMPMFTDQMKEYSKKFKEQQEDIARYKKYVSTD